MRFPGRNKYNMNYSLRRYMGITPTIVYFGRAFGSQYEPVATFFFAILNSTSPGLQIMALVAVASAWSSVSAPPVCLTQQTVAQSSVT